MNHKEKARELFLKGYNCAQSVFAAFSDVTGMDEKTALMLSSSFGGGIGRMREVCGACSGMFMVAGMLYGYSSSCNDKEKATHYALIQQMAADFKKENNDTIICRELLSSLKPGNSATPSKRNDEYYKKRPCLKFVEDAAEIMDKVIAEKSIK